MAGLPQPDLDNRIPRQQLIIPNLRKYILYSISGATLVNIILVIVSLVYPVPQFSSSMGLLRVGVNTTALSADMRKRDILPQPSGLTRLIRQASSSAPSHWQEKAVPSIVQRSNQLSMYWDDVCGCMQTVTLTTTSTHHSTKTIVPTPTSTTIVTYDIQATSSTSTSTSSGNDTSASNANNVGDDPGNFYALWLGILGGCLQKESGTLVCTASSFMPDFAVIYEQAGLSANVTAQLPNNNAGAPIGMLIGIIAFSFSFLAFVFATSPSIWAYGPNDYARHLDMRHQWVLAFADGLATIGTLAVLASTITMRNATGSAVEAVSAWSNGELEGKLLNAYSLLYTASALGGGVVISGLTLIAMDFRVPWWMGQAQTERNPWELAAVEQVPVANPYGAPMGAMSMGVPPTPMGMSNPYQQQATPYMPGYGYGR